MLSYRSHFLLLLVIDVDDVGAVWSHYQIAKAPTYFQTSVFGCGDLEVFVRIFVVPLTNMKRQYAVGVLNSPQFAG